MEKPQESELEELDRKIKHARDTAEEVFHPVDGDEQRFVDSGETPEEDDQTIAPG